MVQLEPDSSQALLSTRARLSVARALLVGAAILSALLPAAARAAEPDPAAAMYTPDSVVAIDLTLPPASLKALEAEPPTEEYQPGTFSLATTDGTPGGIGEFSPPLTVGIRLKGSASFRSLAGKAAFKVKFNFVKGQKFLGLKRLTLNNMVQDPSMVRETLAYEVFRALGLAAPRTGYAFLRINGIDYGIYLNVETFDDISLPRWFDSTRHLYEADGSEVDVSPGGAGRFEVDEGDDQDLSDLEALIDAVNEKGGDWSEAVEPVADLPQMSRMWAVERYVGHWDGYAGAGPFLPNNYYLHSDAAGRFRMLPWGADQTWESRLGFEPPAGGLLAEGCLADSDCLALYVSALEDLQSALPSLDLEDKVACLAERLAPWQAREDKGRREYDAGAIATGVLGTQRFVQERPGELAQWFGSTAPAPPSEEPPCSLPAPPAEAPLSSPGIGADVPPGSLRTPAAPAPLSWRKIALDGRVLRARVELPAAGRLRLEAWAGDSASGRRICRGEEQAYSAGSALAACRIHRATWRQLGSGPLRLTLRASFAARPGQLQTATRTVSLPRR